MKVRILFDVSPEGYVCFQNIESDIIRLNYATGAPPENSKRYICECEVPDPYTVIETTGTVKEVIR